jgi:anti-sigma regulatory factor (Ser/Thr protein kinase)
MQAMSWTRSATAIIVEAAMSLPLSFTNTVLSAFGRASLALGEPGACRPGFPHRCVLRGGHAVHCGMSASRPRARAQDIALMYTWTSCTPGATAMARATLRRALDRMGLASEVISDTVLAVSELVANATEHACGPYELALRRTEAERIYEIHDRDPRIPEVPAAPAETGYALDAHGCEADMDTLYTVLAERGRGLRIVEHLFKGSWGFRLPGDGRKIAWVSMPVSRGTRAMTIP